MKEKKRKATAIIMYNNYDKWPSEKKIIYIMYPPTFAISTSQKKKRKKKEEIVDSPFSVQETRKGKRFYSVISCRYSKR